MNDNKSRQINSLIMFHKVETALAKRSGKGRSPAVHVVLASNMSANADLCVSAGREIIMPRLYAAAYEADDSAITAGQFLQGLSIAVFIWAALAGASAVLAYSAQ